MSIYFITVREQYPYNKRYGLYPLYLLCEVHLFHTRLDDTDAVCAAGIDACIGK